MFGALNNSVYGIQAQERAFNNISANVANTRTYAYKAVSTTFKSLINDDKVHGVLANTRNTLSIEGSITPTDVETDLSIKGKGMFIMNTLSDGKGDTVYGREGSFRVDKAGNLVNVSGGRLMGWIIAQDPTTGSESNSGELGVINIGDIKSDATETKNLWLSSVNLQATEDVANGATRVIHAQTSADTEDIIAGQDLVVGDSLSFSVNNRESSFHYGGMSGGKSIKTMDVFGAKNSNETFSALKNGDFFEVDVNNTSHKLIFETSNPNTLAGEFNNLRSLTTALHNIPDINASLSDEKLYVSNKNPDESISFSSINNSHSETIKGTSDVSQIYGSIQSSGEINSIDLSVKNAFGAATLLTTFNAGLPENDGIRIILSDGTYYTLTKKSNSPLALSREFNSGKTLIDAINTISGLSASQTTAGVEGITIRSNDPERKITSILNHNTTSKNSDLASVLGIKRSSIFGNGAYAGDTLQIQIGAFDKVQSSTSKRYRFDNENSVFGTSITSGPLKGITAGTDDLGTLFNTIHAGDTITLKSSLGMQTFKYTPSPQTNNQEFSSLNTLATAINTTAATLGLQVSVNTDSAGNLSLDITSSVPTQSKILSITNGTSSSKIADILNINTITPTNNDKLSIAMDDGNTYTVTFVDGDIKNKDEFNNIHSLISSLNYASRGRIQCDASPGEGITILTMQRSFGKIKEIKESGSNVLKDFFGLNAKAQDINLTYKAPSLLPGTVVVPDYKLGEFYDIYSLSKAIAYKSNNQMALDYDETNTKTLSLSMTNGGKILSVYNGNITGNSNFADNLGLRHYDILSALNLKDVGKGNNRFASLIDVGNALKKTYDNINIDEAVASYISVKPKSVLTSFSAKNTPDTSLTTFDYDTSDFVNTLRLNEIDTEPTYIPLDDTKNMSSGSIAPTFVNNLLSIYDSLGTEHKINSYFMKTDTNKWVVEFSVNPTEVQNNRKDGLIAYGSLTFDGDGKFDQIDFHKISTSANSNSQSNNVLIPWSNGASPGEVEFVFSGKNGGLGVHQLSKEYEFSGEQDGSSIGVLRSIEISKSGDISALFSNGFRKNVYRVPLAIFQNEDALLQLRGGLYSETSESGTKSIQGPGRNSIGEILSKNLENSNVEMLAELTKMMPAQHTYQACSRVLQVSNRLLDELEKIFG